MIPSRIVAALVLVVLACLVAVVTYGMVTRTLGANAALVALSTLLSGTTIAALASSRGDKK